MWVFGSNGSCVEGEDGKAWEMVGWTRSSKHLTHTAQRDVVNSPDVQELHRCHSTWQIRYQANTAFVASALSLTLRDIRLRDAAFQVAPSGRPVVCDKRFDSEVRMMPTGRWKGCDVFGQLCGAWLDAS